MKQQYLLFLAMGILVVYSLTFPQKELNQNTSSNDNIKNVKENNKENQLVSFKIDEIKSQLMQTESYMFTSMELTSKFFIQDENQNKNFSTVASIFPRIDFRMRPLQI
jgi:hypothetical protein